MGQRGTAEGLRVASSGRLARPADIQVGELG